MISLKMKRVKQKSRILPLILLAVGVYLIVSFSWGLVDLFKKGEEVKKANLRLTQAQEKNLELKEELEYVQSREFIEKEAREKLGLGKEGETVIILPEDVEKLVGLRSSQPEESKPNWKKWLELFFES